MKRTIKTIKLPIDLSDDEKEVVLSYQRNQNNVIRFTYNRLLENDGLTTAEITALQKKMNNVFIDSHFKNSAIYKAKELVAQGNDKVIFGGKKLFVQRCQGKISVDVFQAKKLIPMYSVGESNQSSNRKFTILENNVIFSSQQRKYTSR
jgi:predicted transposase